VRPPSSPRRFPHRVAGAVLALGIGFAWGFVTERRKTFPFSLLKRIAAETGFPRSSPLPEPAREQFSRLQSLPYISGSYDPAHERRGVLLYEPEKCQDGYNLYSSGLGHCSALIDMKGHVLWRWCAEQALGPGDIDPKGWINPLFSAGGTFLLNVQDRGIFRIDEFSRASWKFDAPSHHDVYAAASGEVVAPEHRRRPGSPAYEGEILDDGVLVLDADGKLREEISLYDLFLDSPYAFLLPRTRLAEYRGKDGVEPFHLNHVEVLDGSLSSLSPLYRAGNLLISLRHLSCVAIVDSRNRKILWAWGPGNVVFQHDPTMLPNGDVLIFDNGLKSSQVVEVDPRTDRVVWSYAPHDGFFSPQLGAAQRLENGNTLVTESDRGYAFEVSPAGEVVWRFANPEVDASGFRSGILRMTRYGAARLPFLRARLPDATRVR